MDATFVFIRMCFMGSRPKNTHSSEFGTKILANKITNRVLSWRSICHCLSLFAVFCVPQMAFAGRKLWAVCARAHQFMQWLYGQRFIRIFFSDILRAIVCKGACCVCWLGHVISDITSVLWFEWPPSSLCMGMGLHSAFRILHAHTIHWAAATYAFRRLRLFENKKKLIPWIEQKFLPSLRLFDCTWKKKTLAFVRFLSLDIVQASIWWNYFLQRRNS